jgi:hypothetical protein
VARIEDRCMFDVPAAMSADMTRRGPRWKDAAD